LKQICLFSLLAMLVLLLVAIVFPQWLLTVESSPAKSDVIVVLGGEPRVRVARALEIYRVGLAPKILVSGAGDCSENIRQLVAGGVPRAAIIAECASKTTMENARFCGPLLRQQNARKIIVVTSWYHSRRALACFEKAVPGVEILSLPTQPKDSSVTPRQYVVNEYLKLGYYVWEHGIWPVGL
jgi:uncharacterized SAM-binding protein YcdF (DUF218 family)